MTTPSETHYIGATFSDADDNESKNDIRKRCEKAFKQIGIKEKVYFMEESWYDG